MAAVPTTPPSTYTFGTSLQASNLASLAGTNIAAQGGSLSYNAAQSSSSSRSPVTVTYGGSSSDISSNSASGSGVGGWWSSLSNGAKYGIYGGAGVVALIIIGLIILLVVRKRRRNEKRGAQLARNKSALRMTQRSSFASPMHDTLAAAMSGQHALSSSLSGPVYSDNNVQRSHSEDSLQKYPSHFAGAKHGGVNADAYSVHSVQNPAPAYGQNTETSSLHNYHSQYANGQHQQHQQGGYAYPSSHDQQYQYHQPQQAQYGHVNDYAYPPASPPQSQHSAGRGSVSEQGQRSARNPYAAFAQDDREQLAYDHHGYTPSQGNYNGRQGYGY